MMKTRIAAIFAVLAFAATGFAQGVSKPQNTWIMSQESARYGWGKTGSTITNVIARITQPATLVFDAGMWTVSNSVTFDADMTIEMTPGCSFYIGTNVTMTFTDNDWLAGADRYFYGEGVATGTVHGMWGCMTNWNALTYAANYYLTCVGLDPESAFITATQGFGGDVYGTYDNLQIKTGVVTTVEILDGTITTNDLAGDIGTSLLDTNALYALLSPMFARVWFDAEQVVTQSDATAPTFFAWKTVDVTDWNVPSGVREVGGECRIAATDAGFGRASWRLRSDDTMTEIIPASVIVGGDTDVTNDVHVLWTCPVTTNAFDMSTVLEGAGGAMDQLQYHLIIRNYKW